VPTRAAAALLCVLLIGAAILPAAIGLCQRSGRMSCCMNEATCPMHRKASRPCFNACDGHSQVTSAPFPNVRATLADEVHFAPRIALVAVTARVERTPASFSARPVTPPPRLG
jgi:hypothetical protein